MSAYFDWDAAWTAIDTDLAVANGADDTSDAISLDGKVAAELSLKVVYAAGSPVQGVRLHLLCDTDGTTYESEADAPFAIVLPYSGGGTYRRTVPLDPGSHGSVKVLLTNDSGVAVTCTTKVRFAVLGSG